MWHALMFVNEFAEVTKIPKAWLSIYMDDFKDLLVTYSKESLIEIIALSQTKGERGQAKYNVRPEALKKTTAAILYRDVEKLKKDKAKWSTFVKWFNDHLLEGRLYRDAAKNAEMSEYA
jgi:hypothetical protein